MGLEYDGMPKKKQETVEKEVNQDELVGYIMRNTVDLDLTFGEVQAVLDAETHFLIDKGYMDPH